MHDLENTKAQSAQTNATLCSQISFTVVRSKGAKVVNLPTLSYKKVKTVFCLNIFIYLQGSSNLGKKLKREEIMLSGSG